MSCISTAVRDLQHRPSQPWRRFGRLKMKSATLLRQREWPPVSNGLPLSWPSCSIFGKWSCCVSQENRSWPRPSATLRPGAKFSNTSSLTAGSRSNPISSSGQSGLKQSRARTRSNHRVDRSGSLARGGLDATSARVCAQATSPAPPGGRQHITHASGTITQTNLESSHRDPLDPCTRRLVCACRLGPTHDSPIEPRTKFAGCHAGWRKAHIRNQLSALMR